MNSIKQNTLLELKNGRQFLNANIQRLHKEIIVIKWEKKREAPKNVLYRLSYGQSSDQMGVDDLEVLKDWSLIAYELFCCVLCSLWEVLKREGKRNITIF